MKYIMPHETGCDLAKVPIEWLIAKKRKESLTSHALTDSWVQPNTGQWDCDGFDTNILIKAPFLFFIYLSTAKRGRYCTW